MIVIFGAFFSMNLLSNILYGISPTYGLTYLIVTLSMLGVVLLACLVPSVRAMKIDPIISLRYE